MNRQTMSWILLGLLTGVSAVVGEEMTGASVAVPRCVNVPTIDGKIAPEEWAGAAVIDLKGAAEPTRFKVMCNDDAIYIAADCGVPKWMSRPPAPEMPPRDQGDIWATDHIELWFQMPGKEGKQYQFAVSDVLGIADLAGQPKDDISYNPEWSYAVGRGAACWTAEMAIPKSALQAGEWPATIAFNVGRDGPLVKECCWSAKWGYATNATLMLEQKSAVKKGTQKKIAKKSPESAIKLVDRHVVLNNPRAAPPYDTWANAAADIQTAVNAAQADETVWVSNGTYICRSNSTVDDLTAMITVTRPITIKSMNGPAVTIVDGNYPAFTNRCFYLRSGAILEGFTIRNGHATDVPRGGGVYIASSGRLTNCWITANSTTNIQIKKGPTGGGVWCGGIGEVLNCRIDGNISTNPTMAANCGGIYFAGGGGIIRDCVISNNYAFSPPVDHHSFPANYAIICISSSSMSVSNCTIINNKCGGILISGPRSIPRRLDNCRIMGNKGGMGGIMISGRNAIVRNCRIINNGGWADYGGWGIHMMRGAKMYDSYISSTNSGGVWIIGSPDTVVQNCTIISNITDDCGGAVHMYDGTIRNCLIAYNQATGLGYGGGIYCEYVGIDLSPGEEQWTNWTKVIASTARVENCTIIGNRADKRGGGICCSPNCATTSVEVVNTIFYANIPTDMRDAGGVSIYDHGCIVPTDPLRGSNNITNDPMFVNMNAGDFRLRKESPCINAGKKLDWMSGAVDLDGNPRMDKASGLPDMGCYVATGKACEWRKRK